jgi:hypothetical protein
MRISVEHLLEVNQAGKLAVSNWEVTSKPGDKAMRYRFSLDVRHFDATIGYRPSWGGLRPAKLILFLRALCASVARPIRGHARFVGPAQIRDRHGARVISPDIYRAAKLLRQALSAILNLVWQVLAPNVAGLSLDSPDY